VCCPKVAAIGCVVIFPEVASIADGMGSTLNNLLEQVISAFSKQQEHLP